MTRGLEDEPEKIEMVEKAIKTSMDQLTALYFTDRASYASLMGKEIIVLENGKVVQQGTYDQLRSQNGALSKMILQE